MPFTGNCQEFLDELTGRVIETSFHQLIKAPTCQDKIKVLTQDESIMNQLVNCVEVFKSDARFSKSKEKAQELREKGNFLVQNNKPLMGLKYYSLSLCYAPPESPEYLLGLVNRSVALFVLKNYKDCVADIDLALEVEKDLEKKVKLFKRKGKALLKLGKKQSAIDVLKNALELLVEGKAQKMKKLKEEIQSCLRAADGGTVSDKIHEEESSMLPQVTYGLHNSFHSASCAVDMRSNKEKGRFVVANRDIKMGDTLFVEKPVAFVILPHCARERCGHCLKELSRSIPCLKCSAVIYCSDQCRELAWNEFHKYECGPGLDLCYSLGIAHLAFRLGILSMKPPPDYALVQGLISHINHLTAPDLVPYCLTALLLSLFLVEHTDFDRSTCLDELGGIILEHIGQMICNGNSISTIEKDVSTGENVYEEEQIRVGTAIYPSASMMNHSCDPNIMTSFVGQHIVVKAMRSIRNGEEVFNCYGPNYRRMSYEERQKNLWTQYNFNCDCPPCTDPQRRDFIKKFHAFLCTQCSGPLLHSFGDFFSCVNCSKSSTLHNTSSLISQFEASLERVEHCINENKVQEALQIGLDSLSSARQVLYKHHVLIRSFQDKVAKCYALLGNHEESFKHVEETLETIREQFGQESMELASELIKLFDISCALIVLSPRAKQYVEQAMALIDSAKKIVNVHLDSKSSMITKVDECEETFKDFLGLSKHQWSSATSQDEEKMSFCA